MGYKDDYYENYYTTHILPRKGEVTLKSLTKKFKVFDLHFGGFLPEDRSSRIIDAGCGNGSLVHWLQERGYDNTSGVDGSPDQIEAGKALGIKNLEAINLVTHLQSCPDTFDLIFLRDVVEHFDKADVLPLFRVCRSALRPSGRLVIQVPNGASPWVGRVLYGDFTHETAYTQSSLAQIFLLAGYENYRAYPFLPHLPPTNWRSILSNSGRSAILRRIAWSSVSKIYSLMLQAEIGQHQTVTTFNLIASGTNPK